MQVYLFDIYLSLIIFPLIAALLTLPYLIYQYRTHGVIPWQKTLLFFVFVLYLSCAYFLVILPLPADTTAVTPYAQTPQLIPFHFFAEVLAEAQSSSLFEVLTGPQVYEYVFNILLLVPLGFILRYYLKRKWWQALLIGAAVSLFFELSQLTGLFGMYEHPYRLFDVDDLIGNTVGAMIGYWVALPVSKHLPDLETITAKKARHEHRASIPRRLAALIIDVISATACSIILALPLSLLVSTSKSLSLLLTNSLLGTICTLIGYLLIFVIIPTITKGQTLGQKAVKITLVKTTGEAPRWFHYLINYGVFFSLLYLPSWLSNLLFQSEGSSTRDMEPLIEFVQSQAHILLVVWLALALAWFISFVVRAYRSRKSDQSLVLLNELISNTRTIALDSSRRILKDTSSKNVSS